MPVNRNHQLPKAVLNELPSLSHQPRRLPVIADGRCSVASVLLARRVINDAHMNKQGRQAIDAERRRLGSVIVDKWTVADWVRRVPIHVRGAHMPYDGTDSCWCSETVVLQAVPPTADTEEAYRVTGLRCLLPGQLRVQYRHIHHPPGQ